MTVFWLVGLAPIAALAQSAPRNLPPPKALLKLRPAFPGVEYDTPADQAAIDACKVETVQNPQKQSIGYALRDGQGKLLRRFIDADGNGQMDQWSYYQDGFEVYRERDLDGNHSLDESRWLNAGGTRIAAVEGGKIRSWKQITAEEASKVVVQALAGGDLSLLETVMATPAELTAAGVPKEIVDKVAAAAEKRAEQVAALQKSLVGWSRQTAWSRLDGTFPHVIPADPGTGLEKDLTLYENAMILPGSPGDQQDPAKVAFLQVPDLIKLGPCWKLIELPRAIEPDKPILASISGVRAILFDRANNVQPRDEAMDAGLKALADFDNKNAPLLQGGDKREVAGYHVKRIQFLRGVIAASKTPEDRLNYNKQVVDSLVAALRSDFYPAGREPLEAIIAKGGKLASYAAYSLIGAEFAMENDKPGANVLANQKKWMTDLDAFLGKYPDADEAPDVLLQLASANEFNAEEKVARDQYSRVVERYSASEAAKKAAGALRRLDLVGKSLVVKGAGLRNEVVDSSQSKGKTVLVVFWATWAEPVKKDLPDLVKVYDKYRGRGLEVVGISLDNDRADLDAFLKANQLAWPQIYEPGGMESRLAIDYGIISLPTMFLVDAEGKVVNRNLRTSTEVDRQLEKLLPQKATGVALDRR